VAYNPCGVNEASRLLTNEVLKSLFWRGEGILGRAVFAAKCSVITWYPTNDSFYGPAVLWTLLGDPALRVRHGSATAVEAQEPPGVPETQLLVSPGPARSGVSVRYYLPGPARVRLVLFSAAGSTVSVLADGRRPAGVHRVSPDGTLPAGAYFVRLVVQAEGQAMPRQLTAKLTLLY
jgi:hypothetical protein